MNSSNSTSINKIIINRKFVDICNPVFFVLIDVQSFEIFPKHKEYFFISESFALKWCVIVALTNKKLLSPL